MSNVNVLATALEEWARFHLGPEWADDARKAAAMLRSLSEENASLRKDNDTFRKIAIEYVARVAELEESESSRNTMLCNRIDELEAERDRLCEYVEELEKVLGETALQIEYLHDKFKQTGSGLAVLTLARTALERNREGIPEELVEDLRGWELVMYSDAEWKDLEPLFRKKDLARCLSRILAALENKGRNLTT